MSHPSTSTPRLPLGTVVKDTAGRIGEIVDTGLEEDLSRVYYVHGDGIEWKADAADLTVLPGWPAYGGSS